MDDGRIPPPIRLQSELAMFFVLLYIFSVYWKHRTIKRGGLDEIVGLFLQVLYTTYVPLHYPKKGKREVITLKDWILSIFHVLSPCFVQPELGPDAWFQPGWTDHILDTYIYFLIWFILGQLPDRFEEALVFRPVRPGRGPSAPVSHPVWPSHGLSCPFFYWNYALEAIIKMLLL
jgi:hypothetical protein